LNKNGSFVGGPVGKAREIAKEENWQKMAGQSWKKVAVNHMSKHQGGGANRKTMQKSGEKEKKRA